jgi:hypothetical protein
MPPRKAVRAAAPDGASDPRQTDQLGGVIGRDATSTSPSRQAQERAAERLRAVLPCASVDDTVAAAWKDARRLYGWHDVAHLQVGGRA